MRSQDVIQLYSVVGTGARVTIATELLKTLMPGLQPAAPSHRFVRAIARAAPPFHANDRPAYEKALNQREFRVDLVGAIQAHETSKI